MLYSELGGELGGRIYSELDGRRLYSELEGVNVIQ